MNHGVETPVQIDVIAEGRMLLVLGLLITVVAVLLAFPDTSIGQGLRRALVNAPARILNRVHRGKAAFYLGLAILGLLLTLVFEFEGARLFGLLLPDTLVWFAMFDVGVFVDALLITGAILATNGLRVARTQAAMLRGRVVAALTSRRSARAPRSRGATKRPTRTSADDHRPAWAQPGYRAFSMA